MSDDSVERETRARELREEIARLEEETGTGPAAGEEDQPRPGESINDFGQRRPRAIRRKAQAAEETS